MNKVQQGQVFIKDKEVQNIIHKELMHLKLSLNAINKYMINQHVYILLL
jgi:hypothetical protein